MGKSSQQTQTQSNQSTTNPWGAAEPLLTNAIGALSGQSTAVTGDQNAALGNLTNTANGLPTFDTTGNINSMLGFDTSPQVGMLGDALKSTQASLSPLTNPANLNPMNTPGMSDAINTMTNDITNNVKGVYAGSGRDPSGAGSFAGSLARGLTQGIAPVLTSQYNANVGNLTNATNASNNAAVTDTGAMTGQETAPMTQAAQAIGLIPQAANAALTPAQAQLTAANTAYQLPYGNIMQMLQPAMGLGGMGSSTSGTGTSTTSQPQSTAGNVAGGIMGGVGMLSQMGGSAGIAGLAPLLAFSDERVKDDVKEVGELHDGQKVYSYRYKGDPKTQIGLLAQEVYDHEPDAVFEHAPTGLLMVDYARATHHAAHMRMAA